MGVPPLLRYHAVPTATAPRAMSVEGSERNPTRDEESDILNRLECHDVTRPFRDPLYRYLPTHLPSTPRI